MSPWEKGRQTSVQRSFVKTKKEISEQKSVSVGLEYFFVRIAMAMGTYFNV